MGVIDDLVDNNRAFSARVPDQHLDVKPSSKLTIVTCMDSRLDVFQALGLEDGQAHILRNAGGVITDDVIRSLSISQRKLGTESIMLIHHTDCGMQKITDDGFRSELQEATGTAPAFAIESFVDELAALLRRAYAPERIQGAPEADDAPPPALAAAG